VTHYRQESLHSPGYSICATAQRIQNPERWLAVLSKVVCLTKSIRLSIEKRDNQKVFTANRRLRRAELYIAHLAQCISPVVGSLIRGITWEHLTTAASDRTVIIQDCCSTVITPQFNLLGQYAGITIPNAANYTDIQRRVTEYQSRE